MSCPIIPNPIVDLTPELQGKLKDHVEDVLARIVDANLHTRYAQESPVFNDFRNAVGHLCDECEGRKTFLLEAFYATVPLTTYASHEPFVAKLLQQPCREGEIKDLFAPGLPVTIASSSTTSGRTPKLFPKYLHPLGSDRIGLPFSKTGGNTCATFSMASHRVVGVRGDAGGEDKRIPVAFISTCIIRMLHDLDLDKDTSLMKMIMPGMTSPFAVTFLRNYRSFLLVHALFALVDRKLEILFASLSTIFVDMIRYMEEEWDTLVYCIEMGKLPDYEGVDEIREHLQPNFPRNPSRAAELRAIGISTATPGWLAKIWPGLKTAVSIVSGVFSAAVPKMQHYVGPNVHIRAVGYIASEGSIGTVYDPQELNLFRSITGDVVEYLDVSLDETAAGLVPAWELQTGHKYEIVLTTRNGLWRYRMEDIVEIAGFDPRDGTPILKYVERRNAVVRLGMGTATGKTLTDAIFSVEKSLGKIVEFTVLVDERVMPPRIGFLVEVEGAVGQLTLLTVTPRRFI
ncbi:hypothetical protein BV22DRAFT_1135171 [Leucogyrophana mollusca]|uniref:Uncharacterized protein n=1 Tax=Leucogyrophana mollusca TaxID=85980 RepID=A0ACB8AWR1_9AGAM|nr:hypothetical protein BV22DRAFT_1135171 [Leucogyrophana mollusca]